MWLLKTSVASNATRQWLLIAISHVVLYDVKRNLAANKAHFWDWCRNMGHFRYGVEKWWNFIFTKVVKFDYSHSKLRKQHFVAEILKIHGGPWPPFRRPYICNVCEFLGTNYCIPKRWPMGPLQQRLLPLAQTSNYATVCKQCLRLKCWRDKFRAEKTRKLKVEMNSSKHK